MRAALDWASHLKRYRRVNRLTQAALAELLSTEQATVSRWEGGVNQPELALQRRLRDLLFRGTTNCDRQLLHYISHSPFAVKVADKSARNLAASSLAAELHGVPQRQLARADYRPHFTERLSSHWDRAVEMGFFEGDVASIQVLNAWYPLGGGSVRCCVSYWSPARLSDGEVVLISEFREIDSPASGSESFLHRHLDDLACL